MIVGAEYTLAKDLLYGYFSRANFDRNVTSDNDGASIGFGIAGSTAANHTLHETTVGVAHTFFRDPKIGGLQVMFQYSNLARTPFSVPANTPSHATVNMVYVNLRYLLP